MTLRQKVLKAMYPAFMSVSNLLKSKATVELNTKKATPAQSFYDISFKHITSSPLSMNDFKGRKILVVNTASDCAFTPQLTELEQLQKDHLKTLVVVGFPSNDFKNQDKGTDVEIEAFCKNSYGVNFLLAQKSIVVKHPLQTEVYRWLTRADINGWNEQQPEWNFSKYLIDEDGRLMAYFGPAVSPISAELTRYL